jgi:hypothetical protein
MGFSECNRRIESASAKVFMNRQISLKFRAVGDLYICCYLDLS